ncbi:MAG: hypothetical protein GY768_03770 [Planctomycetaceae bacterium]|nr:hypothetical protein [Planctomycetaceae bacterium]
MASRLINIATFDEVADAYMFRNQLERRGIAAVVHEPSVASALWQLSVSGGGAKLQVHTADASKARALLLAQLTPEAAAELSQFWRCEACEEIVDPGFDVCWSCSKARGEVEDQGFEPTLATVGIAGVDLEDDSQDCPALVITRSSAESTETAADPSDRAVHASAASPDSTRMMVENPARAADEMVMRAWRAAIMGLFICPPLLNIYSMCLLVRVGWGAAKTSPKASRRFYAAMVVNLLSTFSLGFYRWVELIE